MFKKTNFISYLIATFFVIGLYVLSRLYSLVSGTEIFFLSVITQILWIIIVYLFYKQQQIKKPIIYASKLIGLSNYTDDLVEIVKNFADEFTRFHRTINAFQSEGHISSIDLGARLRKIAKLVLLEMKANAVEIALFDEVSQQWSQAMVIGAPRCSDSQAMFAEIQESKVKKIISQGGFQIIALPLLMGGSVYGVIRVEIPSSRRPTKNDLELLNLFSSQGALALVDTRYTDELLRMRRASDESTKAKTGFLANLSHEIRGPLGTILNGVELMQDGLCGEVTEEQKNILGMVKSSGDHLLDLVNDVLDYAKIEAGKVQPYLTDISVKEILEDITTTLTPQVIEKKHELTLADINPELFISCDKRHARQILINLLTNAIKYTPEGGKIEVDAKQVVPGRIKISVKDNGIGIPEEQKDKVFTAFERVQDRYAIAQVGAGLGMPLSLKLANLNSGNIEFETELGKGSTFFLELPAKEKKDVVREIVEESKIADTQQGNGEKILIIDHDSNAQMMLSKYLINQGFEIIQAENKEEVEQIIGKRNFQLAIVENDLPDLPGEQVLNTIRDNPSTNRVPIILLSAKAFVFDIERFIKIGADRCLSKPVQLDEIASTIRVLLDSVR